MASGIKGNIIAWSGPTIFFRAAGIAMFICSLSSMSAHGEAVAAKTQAKEESASTRQLEAALRSHKIQREDLSLMVSTDVGETVFELNADAKKIPASLTKIVTAAAALHFFAPGHRFTTSLLAGQPIREGVLKGPLYLKGGGDPSFVSEDMWELVNELKRTELSEIQGPIIVDESRFDDERFDQSRDPERVDRAYDAPVGAMSFNWNSVNIFVRPGEKAGAPARVYLDPENDFTVLQNQATTVAADGKNTIDVQRQEVKEKGQIKNKLIVRGALSVNAAEVVKYKSITQPGLWAGANLRSFLAQRGIRVVSEAPEVRIGKVAEGATLLADVESKDLSAIVADMQKFSNNYVAEMLTKNLAAEFVRQPAQLGPGFQQVMNYLDVVGITRDRFYLQSPSGLSRKNRLTARDTVAVLNYSQKEFRIGPELLVALPIASVDGTLKNRLKDPAAYGRIRAKTGMLDGAFGLAGFAGRPDGRRLTFAFIYNGPKDWFTVRSLFDDLALALVK